MEIKALSLDGVFLLTPRRFADDRGFFCETYRNETFDDAIGRNAVFVQDNHSYSAKKGTVRGLHFQAPPFAQGKLVRVARGRIFDVAVDIRKGSPTYGRWTGAELSAQNGEQLFVPEGFLHGFATLEDDVDVLYKVTSRYDKESEGAVYWADEELNIDWGVDISDAVTSEKDGAALPFSELDSPF